MSIINSVATTGDKSNDHRIAFINHGKPKALSIAQVDLLAGILADRLLAAGFERGDRIGVIARNGIEWVLLDLAAIKSALVTAGFEFGYHQSVDTLVDKYELKGIYADIDSSQSQAIDIRPLIDGVLALDPDNLPNNGLCRPAIRYQLEDCITIKFSSGSTGEPKGLLATVGSIDHSIASVQSIFKHDADDNILVFLPLSLLQQRYWIYSALAYGHNVTVTSYQYALHAATMVQPTVVMGVPGFFESVKRHVEQLIPETIDDVGHRRRSIETLLGRRIRYLWTGSAPASSDMLRFFGNSGIDVFEGYGMNETCIVSKNYPGHHKPGSCGRLLPSKRARIDDDGVLIVGSEHPVNTAYAYCAPGDNERVFLPDGEVRTGDLARFDQDGYLYILGRADDLVVLANGRNINVSRIEEEIRQHSAIDNCVLFGSGKRYLVAVISPSAPITGPDTEQEIVSHLETVNSNLPHDERVIKSVVVPEPFSIRAGLLTSQLKPKRKEIFRRYKKNISELYEATA